MVYMGGQVSVSTDQLVC